MQRFLAFALATLAVVAACGSDDDPAPVAAANDGGAGTSSGTSGTPAPTDAGTDGAPALTVSTERYVAAFCAWTAKCHDDDLINDYGDVAGCKTINAAKWATHVGLPGFAATQTQLDACAKKYEDVTCADGSKFAECNFAGALADGAPCSLDFQCKGTTCVKANALAVCGTCATRLAAGAACAFAGGRPACEFGLGCDTKKLVCASLLTEGMDCASSGILCAPGLRCSNGTCKKIVLEGGSCTVQDNGCASGLACDTNTSLCVASPRTAVEVGATCPPGTCKLSQCDVGTKKCVAYGEVGETCGVTPKLCKPGLTCRGKCEEDDPTSCK